VETASVSALFRATAGTPRLVGEIDEQGESRVPAVRSTLNNGLNKCNAQTVACCGCKFDANDKLTECGIVTIREDEIVIIESSTSDKMSKR
jgi:hypothetical protein